MSSMGICNKSLGTRMKSLGTYMTPSHVFSFEAFFSDTIVLKRAFPVVFQKESMFCSTQKSLQHPHISL